MTDIQKKERKWVLPLLSALALSFTSCVFAPLETYYSVGAELWFDAGDFILPALLCFLALFITLFGAGMLFRGKARAVFCALLFGLSLAFYIQGNFANANYGMLDGHTVEWDTFGSYPFWNTLMWVAIVVAPAGLAVCFYKRTRAMLRFLCGFLTLMLAVSVASLSLTSQLTDIHIGPSFVTTEEFSISKGKNVVVFVLDSLNTTDFSKLLEDDQSLRDHFEDFTWFRKMAGQYAYTHFAIPALLTGEDYLYGTSLGTYMKNAWERETFFHALKADGYVADVYTDSKFAFKEASELVDNIKIQEYNPTSQFALWRQMIKLTSFRYAPHMLKHLVETAGTNFENLKEGASEPIYTMNDVKFLEAFHKQGVNAVREQPSFKFYHLMGAHLPFTLKLDGTSGESTLHEQIKTVLNCVLDYVQQMKKQGVYDNAMIIITADHGRRDVDLAPVLLVKRPGDSGAFVQNDFLVCQQDLHATVAAAMGLTNEINYGKDAFSITEDDFREVDFYNSYFREDKLFEYKVSTDDEGELLYEATGRVHEYGDVKEIEPFSYKLGTKISLEKWEDIYKIFDEKCEYFLKMENGKAWFGMPAARLHLCVADEEYGDLKVTFGVGEIKGESQLLKVIYDGMVQETLTIAKGDTELSFTIPADMINNGELAVSLRFPDAVSEYELSNWTSGEISLQAAVLTSLVIENE